LERFADFGGLNKVRSKILEVKANLYNFSKKQKNLFLPKKKE
jgi:hypothetical protein